MKTGIAGRSTVMGRIHGRITKEDIRAAGLRRWDGRNRTTKDWLSLYQEPELCFPTGDCLVYLREPGQSSRGPSFRVHISQLLMKGFRGLVDRTTQRPILHDPNTCTVPACEGCDLSAMRELYLPAPPHSNLDSTIDFHTTTRNFFAWLYKLPLAGRALGVAAVSLKERIDEYRPTELVRNQLEITTFLEFHRYLDFRECIDHALAALHIAENMELEDLWIDAFAHCVGMSHKGMRASLEFPAIGKNTRAMIAKARLEMDVRLDRVSRSVMNFFESDLSGTFLGLHQAAREHFDRFRSFLHAFYIEQHGFWPPPNFDDECVKKALYANMYSDFRNLYHHLVNIESSPTMDLNISTSGGVCTLQNIQAFDQRHGYEALPHPLPMIPKATSPDAMFIKNRRSSLNLLKKSKVNRDLRIEADMQALMEASNRDWNITTSLLVRRYQEFEQRSVFDEFEHISVVDGRKVRWILIYAVLQTLISVMQAPTQVRNTESLSYSLCCHAPRVMPWRLGVTASSITGTSIEEEREREKQLEPDIEYSHTNSSSSSLGRERRSSLPLSRSGTNLSTGTKTPPVERPKSLRRLLSRKNTGSTVKLVGSSTGSTKAPAFCEIFVQGYGNGLNEVRIETSGKEKERERERDREEEGPAELVGSPVERSPSTGADPFAAAVAVADKTERQGEDEADSSPSTSVSRESSSASAYSGASSKSTAASTAPDVEADGEAEKDREAVVAAGIRGSELRTKEKSEKEKSEKEERRERRESSREKREKRERRESVRDESGVVGLIHFNTDTWDRILGVEA